MLPLCLCFTLCRAATVGLTSVNAKALGTSCRRVFFSTPDGEFGMLLSAIMPWDGVSRFSRGSRVAVEAMSPWKARRRGTHVTVHGAEKWPVEA